MLETPVVIIILMKEMLAFVALFLFYRRNEIG